MALVDLQQTVEDLDASLSSIENVLDPAAKKAEIADLERQVAVPNLWDDQENAQRVTSRLSACLLYTSPSPRDATLSRMPSSA